MTDDGYVMAPGMAPTPFTADEIRQGCPPGRTTYLKVSPAGRPATTTVTRFLTSTPEGGEFESWTEDDAGATVGDRERASFLWTDLQGHASFPENATEIDRETITTPLGEHDCYRYDVTREGSQSTFWFAVNRPGLPVKFMTVANGTPVVTAELVKDERVGG